jgi:hypothetical protein
LCVKFSACREYPNFCGLWNAVEICNHGFCLGRKGIQNKPETVRKQSTNKKFENLKI